MKKVYDVIIIGAGSVGVPIAMAVSEKRLNVLVIDDMPSVGQANNKKAIGGLRATHSDKSKIKVSLRSLEIFSTWQQLHGDDIQWMPNGYSFPAYTEEIANQLQETMKVQHSYGLDISWISPEEYSELVPGIKIDGLIGSTYSPKDGSASPLLAINAFYRKCLDYGCSFHFNETVKDISPEEDGTFKVKSNKDVYSAKFIVNAAGNYSADIADILDIKIPVKPDNHEAGITEPVARFFGPMVVDIRKEKGSANFYFYQNKEGQVVFCLTPDPPIWGIDNDSTSEFLPLISHRMLTVYPRLANLKVRRTWRGQYPMTPDAFPIVGSSEKHPNFIIAAGFCGQGFMLGPGIGEIISRMVTGDLSEEDKEVLAGFSLDRDFSSPELLK